MFGWKGYYKNIEVLEMKLIERLDQLILDWDDIPMCEVGESFRSELKIIIKHSKEVGYSSDE